MWNQEKTDRGRKEQVKAYRMLRNKKDFRSQEQKEP